MSDPEDLLNDDLKIEPHTSSAKNRNKSQDSQLGFKLAPAQEEDEQEGMRPSIIGDDRNEWQKPFYWDDEVDLANKEIFGNQNFREN